MKTLTEDQYQEVLAAKHPKRVLRSFFEPVKLEVGKWYRNGDWGIGRVVGCVTALNEDDNRCFAGYGWGSMGIWGENKDTRFFGSTNWQPATYEEVKELLRKEAIKRFGEDWENAKIEKDAHGHYYGINSGTFAVVLSPYSRMIWNSNGVIFYNGKWAEPLK